MPRLKLQRFRVKEPRPEALARYVRVYASEDLYHRGDTLPPLTARSLFDREAPLTLELGSGRGEFIVDQAREQPDRLFVGIEIHWKSVWDSVNRAEAAGIDNVRFVRADIRQVLGKVPDQSLAEAWVLFPPPTVEYKRRKKDILSTQIVEHLARMLADGALLRFVTDHDDYFAEKVALIRESGWFEDAAISHEFEGGLTRFQQFWENLDIASKRYEAVRVPRAEAGNRPSS